MTAVTVRKHQLALWLIFVTITWSTGWGFGPILSSFAGTRKYYTQRKPLALQATSASRKDETSKPSQQAPIVVTKPTWFTSLIVASVFAFSSPALALTNSVFTNDYADPFHPQCERHIVVSSDGKTFHYSGTAVGPKDDTVKRGCTPDEIKEFGLRKGSFDGEILDGGTKISAGDGVHEGVWEPANSVNTNLGYEDVDGIRWNDGNKWIVKGSPAKKVGEGVFLAYIGVSTLAGVKAIVDAIRKTWKR